MNRENDSIPPTDSYKETMETIDGQKYDVPIPRPRRVLWVGDACVSTGFARVTHAVCDHLHATGWDVAVLGMNYFGSPHSYPYTIYPAFDPLNHGKDRWGVARLPHLVHELQPDVVVFLNDPWNVPGYTDVLRAHYDRREELGHPVPLSDRPYLVGFLAVDAVNMPGDQCNGLDQIATWTEFGGRELINGGYVGPVSVVPLGVDRDVYYPVLRDDARRDLGLSPHLPEDAFIVGAVGRNQYRKRLDLTLDAFYTWISENDISNAYLYLHTAPTGDKGVDLQRLIAYCNKRYNVQGRVILSQLAVGQGKTDEVMRTVYNALDVYLTTTQGEGWGLPVLEAMACGVPCIVPAWSALNEWPREAAVKVPCPTTGLTAPVNLRMYTIGGVVDTDGVAGALHDMYRSEVHRMAYVSRGLQLSREHPWERTGVGMESVLAGVMERPKRVYVPTGEPESGEGGEEGGREVVAAPAVSDVPGEHESPSEPLPTTIGEDDRQPGDLVVDK